MKKIIFGTRSGLGDRFLAIASGLRLSKILNRKPIIWWPKTEACNISFKELFELFKNIKVLEIDREKEKSKTSLPLNTKIYEQNLCLKKKKIKNIQRIFQYINFDYKKENIFIKGRALTYLLEEEKYFNENFIKKIDLEIIKYIRELKPIKELREKINNFAGENFNKNTISIHLRRTDFRVWLENKLMSDEKIISRLKKYLEKNPNSNFFLATDSKQTEKKFKKKFKNKIIIYPKKYWVEKSDKNKKWEQNIYRSPESVKESLIELYLLSKPLIFLKFNVYSGSFNKIASLLNPKQKIIKINEDLNAIENIPISNSIIHKIYFFIKKTRATHT